MKKAVLCTVLALSLAGPALAQNKVTRQIPVDSEFNDVSMRWSGATPGGYKALSKLIVVNGVLELCGVGVSTNIQLNQAIAKGLRGGKLKFDGKTVVKNFSFFAKARSERALRKTPANCVSTGHPASKPVEFVDFSYGDATFRN
ncbi:MAG: hypothetical protein OXC60_19010 [Litoreibacter sp.]|nr:hypothetical protein [Litoreibacter sp.]